MMPVNFVTSFNEELLKNLGHLFFKSIDEQWEPNLKVTGYYHECPIESYSLPNSFIQYKELKNIKEYEKFKKENKVHDGTENGQIPYNLKLDALKWCHKVFALTEHAFQLKENNSNPGWLIWVDVDCYASKRMVIQDVIKMLPEHIEVAYAGKKDNQDNHDIIDTHFMAFNLNTQASLDLLKDLRKTYMNGELYQYREWHDAFITERLLKIYEEHGLKTADIGKKISEYIIHMKATSNPNIIPLRDSKGNRLFELSKDITAPDIRPSRYEKSIELIKFFKPKKILEVGTWNGGRAIEMALAAFEHTDKVSYWGFDLFEDATIETDREEFNVKAHNTMEAVRKRFLDFKHKMKEKNKTFNFSLTKGNSRKTLKEKYFPKVDFAFIGGGNSIKTTQSDYNNLKHIPIIIIDHYFSKDTDEKKPPKEYQGTNKVYDNLPKNKLSKFVIPSDDKVRGGGYTHLCGIVNDKKLPKPPKNLFSVPIKVNPRDCVPKDYIRDNIKENMKLINKDKWIQKFSLHTGHTIIVSGGPYIDFDKVKQRIKENPNTKVVCVKHSYMRLLEQGIKPWACVVLDPRPITGTSTHGIVRKDLFKTIDPTTKFLIASMTDPSVTNHLIENNADIYGWHAFTESLRDPEEQKKGIHNNQVILNKELGIPQGSTLITGGTCAAMRAIGIMHTMGFRFFDLFGFDSSMEEPTEEQKKETTGAEEEEPRPKYFKVISEGEEFWTTGELLAMAQDCENFFNDSPMEMHINFYGKNTLIASVWKRSTKCIESKDMFTGDI